MKFVSFPSLVYFDAKTYELHKQLRAINQNNLITKVSIEDFANSEDKLMSVDELRSIYKSFPDMIANAEKIIDDASFEFDFKTPKNKKTFTGSHYDDKLLLEKLAFNGLAARYGSNNRVAENRVRSELEIINKVGLDRKS